MDLLDSECAKKWIVATEGILERSIFLIKLTLLTMLFPANSIAAFLAAVTLQLVENDAPLATTFLTYE